MTRSPSASIISSLEEALGAQTEKLFKSNYGRPELLANDSGNSLLSKELEQEVVPKEALSIIHVDHEELLRELHQREQEGVDEDALEIVEEEIVAVIDRQAVPEATPLDPTAQRHGAKASPEPEEHMSAPVTKAPPKPKPKRTVKSPGIGSNTRGRSNSPKPTKASKLVTEEKTEFSLSFEEANRIAGMRILLAEGQSWTDV